MENCRKSGNDGWLEKHGQEIMDIVKNDMPSGSGFDNGTGLNVGALDGDFVGR
jgi:hypothetical protein